MQKSTHLERHLTASAYIIEAGRVLLLHHGKLNKWLPPGGHVELNETPSECIKREVLEETGLEIDLILQENLWLKLWNASSIERPYLCLLQQVPAYGTEAAHEHIDMVFIAKPVGGKLFSSVHWFTLNEVDNLREEEEIFSETKTVIHHIYASFCPTDCASYS